MNTTLTIVLVASWILLLWCLFLYERLDRRLAAVQVQLIQILRIQQTVASHAGVEPARDEFREQLRQLVAEGKTYEAIVSYRSVYGAPYKEAKEYVDSLRR